MKVSLTMINLIRLPNYFICKDKTTATYFCDMIYHGWKYYGNLCCQFVFATDLFSSLLLLSWKRGSVGRELGLGRLKDKHSVSSLLWLGDSRNMCILLICYHWLTLKHSCNPKSF